MKACCTACRSSPPPSPAAVTTSPPSWATASARQDSVRLPSSRTVHAPHCPWSQPFLGEVTPSRSRSASRREVRVSTVTVRSRPSTVSVIVDSCTAPAPRSGPGRNSVASHSGASADEVRLELAGESLVGPPAHQRPIGGVLERLHLPSAVDLVQQVTALVGQQRLERHAGPGQVRLDGDEGLRDAFAGLRRHPHRRGFASLDRGPPPCLRRSSPTPRPSAVREP